jgi:hypothetical protein
MTKKAAVCDLIESIAVFIAPDHDEIWAIQAGMEN